VELAAARTCARALHVLHHLARRPQRLVLRRRRDVRGLGGVLKEPLELRALPVRRALRMLVGRYRRSCAGSGRGGRCRHGLRVCVQAAEPKGRRVAET
jgi:hypothetical protein